MATIGVISDTHGALHSSRMENLFPEGSLLLTLGDISYGELIILKSHYSFLGGVKGNCDTGNSLPLSTTIEIDNTRIFLSHKPPRIKISSREEDQAAGYDIVLFGHLHRRILLRENGLVYFSPGAFSGPRDDNGPSVGLIEIREGKFDMKFLGV